MPRTSSSSESITTRLHVCAFSAHSSLVLCLLPLVRVAKSAPACLRFPPVPPRRADAAHPPSPHRVSAIRRTLSSSAPFITGLLFSQRARVDATVSFFTEHLSPESDDCLAIGIATLFPQEITRITPCLVTLVPTHFHDLTVILPRCSYHYRSNMSLCEQYCMLL